MTETETIPAKLYKIDICYSVDDYMRSGDTYQIEEIFIPTHNVIFNQADKKINVFFGDRTRLEGSIKENSEFKFHCAVCGYSTIDEQHLNEHKLSNQHKKKMARINNFKDILIPKDLADKLKRIVDMNRQIDEIKKDIKSNINNLFITLK